jgi:putative flippase GtrA
MVFMLRHALRYLAEHRIQLAKFVFVGIVTFGINFLFFHLFYGLLHWDYRIAVSLAYVITVSCHFLLHRIITFSAAEQQMVHNVGKYLLMLIVNYGITLTVVGLVVEVVGWSPYIGVIASTAATASTSFFVMKYFVFRSKRALWWS